MSKLLNQFKSLLKYLVAAIIIAVSLYPKFPFIKIPGTYVSIRIEDFLMAFVAIITFALFLPEIKNLLKNKIVRAILILLGIGLVSLISGMFLTKSVDIQIGILHWIRRIEYFIPFFAGLILLKDKKDNLIEFIIKILIIVTIVAAVYGIGQKYLYWPIIVTQNVEYAKGIALRWVPGSHINSTFAGHYDLAAFLILVLPIFIGLFVSLKEIKTKILLFVCIAGGYWLLINAVSRISIVSFMGATTIALILLKKYKTIPVFLILSLLVFSFSPDLRARYLRIFDVIKIKIESIKKTSLMTHNFVYAIEPESKISVLAASPISTPTPAPTPKPVFEDRSSSIRFNVEWPRAIRALVKNPLLGTGYSSITLATDNDYLRSLGETGILGFAAFILLLVNIAISFVKSIPTLHKFNDVERVFLAGTIGSFCGILLNAVFIDIFEASKFAIIFWLLIGISVSLIKYGQNEENN
jgi:hypothetical protein